MAAVSKCLRFFVGIVASLTATGVFAAAPAKHCVWRVTNVAVPFYLVGSIHLLRGDDYPIAPIYRQTLMDSQRLLFEYNPRERSAFEAQIRAAAKYPPGQDIRSEIHGQTLALLVRKLGTAHTRFEDVKQFKPWALAYRLCAIRGYTAAVGTYDLDYHIWATRGYKSTAGTHGLDAFLSYQAQRLGKEVAGLESVEEHVAFWDKMLRLDGERLLLYILTRGTRVNELFAETRRAWKRGDVAALSATNANLRKANVSIARRLLDRRNLKWVERIEAEMKSGKPTAIVAGAGHFSGPNSVVDLLQKRGYKIVQL